LAGRTVVGDSVEADLHRAQSRCVRRGVHPGTARERVLPIDATERHRGVVARTAVQGIVSEAADEGVVARAAAQDVVTRAAVELVAAPLSVPGVVAAPADPVFPYAPLFRSLAGRTVVGDSVEADLHRAQSRCVRRGVHPGTAEELVAPIDDTEHHRG